MLSAKMQTALNDQMNAELYSSSLYLAMSVQCEAQGYKGFARWLRFQQEEERSHALKLLDYVLVRGGRPAVGALEAPPAEFGTVLQVFEATLKHEQHVTQMLHRLLEVAGAERDPAVQVFLQWYVTEQVEEEAAASEIVQKLRIVGDKGSGALYLDKEYGKRGEK